jgi:hypothetical protein
VNEPTLTHAIEGELGTSNGVVCERDISRPPERDVHVAPQQ